jgi:hypothetical protein
MWPSVAVHEHWPVSQRMIVEMREYAWSEHIVTVFLTCQLFAHGDGSTGLMKVVFCYALPTVVQGFGANETLHLRTTTFWAQLLLGDIQVQLTVKGKTTRQLHSHSQKQLCPKCGCPQMKCFVGAKPLHDRR